MLRTLIIDDELHAQKELRFLLSRHPGFVWVGSCKSIREARVLLEGTQPDLVLLDIELEDGNAFELLQSLPEISFRIIFVTAYSEHALRAIKFSALDYLVKPVHEADMAAALQKMEESRPVREQLDQQLALAREHFLPGPASVPGRIALRDQYHIRIVAFNDILYCQSDNGYTTFYLANGRHVLVSRSIKEHEPLLPASQFLRIHQSYIVNLEYIELYHKDGYVVLKNNAELPVAFRRRPDIIRLLSNS